MKEYDAYSLKSFQIVHVLTYFEIASMSYPFFIFSSSAGTAIVSNKRDFPVDFDSSSNAFLIS